MKKFIALLLALCMVFALAACGGGKTAVGNWQAKVDLKELFGQELGEVADYFSDLKMDMFLELKDDNTFTLKMDGSAAIPAFKDAMRSYMGDMLAGMGMTAEDYEALAGQSLDALIDESIAGISEELNQTASGTYTEDGGKLVLTPESGSAINGSWADDSLTLQEDDLGDITFTRK